MSTKISHPTQNQQGETLCVHSKRKKKIKNSCDVLLCAILKIFHLINGGSGPSAKAVHGDAMPPTPPSAVRGGRAAGSRTGHKWKRTERGKCGGALCLMGRATAVGQGLTGGRLRGRGAPYREPRHQQGVCVLPRHLQLDPWAFLTCHFPQFTHTVLPFFLLLISFFCQFEQIRADLGQCWAKYS